MKRVAMILGGLLAAHTVCAGVYVETVDNNLTTGTSQLKNKMYVQGGAGRIVDGDGKVTLIKGDTVYAIDEANKTYVKLDKQALQQLGKQLSDLAAKAKEQLAKLPPEQRAQMEQSLGGASLEEGEQWNVEVKDTGKNDKVDGRSCRLWDVTRNGVLDEQICVVPYNALPGKEDMQAIFANFARTFEEMAKSAPMLGGMMANEFTAQVKTNGYPVRRRVYENGRLAPEEIRLKVWREEAIPASMFEIPAGYQPKQMQMGFGQ